MNITRVARIVAALAALTFLFAACSSDDDSAKQTTTTTTSTPPNSHLGPEQVKALQSDLTRVGCFSGTVDGIVGPVTRAGISAFQKEENLTVDGQYGSSTRKKLAIVAGDDVKVCTTAPLPPTTGPSCTSAAVLAAVPAGSSITDFGCSGEWAWVGVDVNAGQGGYEATELLKAAGNGWTVVDRAQYCVPASEIPPDIYAPGCTTN